MAHIEDGLDSTEARPALGMEKGGREHVWRGGGGRMERRRMLGVRRRSVASREGRGVGS